MEERRKSILKSGNERKPKKKLSFSHKAESPLVGKRRSVNEIVPTNLKDKLERMEVTPEKKQEQEVASAKSHTSNDQSIVVPICKSVKRTPIGLCYDPQKHSERPKTHETIPMKDSKRNKFAALLESVSAAGPTVKVLIVGEKILGEKIKMDLLSNLDSQFIPKGLGKSIIFDVMCESSPSLEQMPYINFFIFLINLDKLESVMDLSNDLNKISSVGIPSHCRLVLSVSSGQGTHKNIDISEFENFLDNHQLIHLTWQEQGRLSDQQVLKLLTLIYNSVGYCRGSSLLMKYILQRGIKEYRDDETMF